jgi:hypothetical protein
MYKGYYMAVYVAGVLLIHVFVCVCVSYADGM